MTLTPQDKADVLLESLPWISRYTGQVIVVKFGGNAMVDAALLDGFVRDIVFLHTVGIRPVIVHGGGPQISAELERRGIPSEFRGGYRVTTAEAISVVRDVLTGDIAAGLVRSLDAHRPGLGVALSGETGGLFGARRRGAIVDGVSVDLGFVGDVEHVDPTEVHSALAAGRIPVVSSIAPELDDSGIPVPGSSLNVNADAAAASLAIALAAAKLVILTDVAGLYRDWPNRDSLISTIDAGELRKLLPSLESGMIPKMTACVDAVTAGVPRAAIIDGRVKHSVLLEIFTPEGSGTEVTG